MVALLNFRVNNFVLMGKYRVSRTTDAQPVGQHGRCKVLVEKCQFSAMPISENSQSRPDPVREWVARHATA